jgi:glutamate-5-semialdehyde dehydrogenase
MKINMELIGKQARFASRKLARLSSERKNAALLAIADGLQTASAEVLLANAKDITEGKEAGLTAALLDRLTLNPARLEGIISDLRGVAELPDPVGETFEVQTLPNGLRVHKQRVPLGVLAVIYEARPNVTIDVAGLAIKTGNAVILRGGSETLNSNRALVAVIRQALQTLELPADIVQFIDDPDRALVGELMQMHEYVDMLIPRGGAALHRFCRENSRIPVITGGIGICHLFVDATADLESAVNVIHNAKVQRPSVCNALDTVLVHRDIAGAFLPAMAERLHQSGVSLRADPGAISFLAQNSKEGGLPEYITPAGLQDFDTEWLSLILGVKVVADMNEAIAHIEAHSTAHSDGILTRDKAHAQRFISEVDSAAVYVNASTRFTDGGQLGLGAEVAISTQRLHARGPMGLRELTTYKWVIQGDNHVRP